jgi:hypothetical protein
VDSNRRPTEIEARGSRVFGMGGHNVEIVIMASSNDSAKLSQAEINRILTSRHAIAAEPWAVPSAHLTAVPK